MKYCEFCRKELTDNEVCACEESIAYAKKKAGTKKKALIFGLGIALVLIIAVLAIALGSASEKNDPFLYVNVSFDGYSSDGTAVVKFDKESLICSIIGKEPESFKEMLKWSEEYDMYADEINYSITPSEELSNGDIVTVSITVTGTAQNKINSGEKEYTVKGLTEVETIDVFKEIEVSFEGVSGKGRPILKYNSESDFLAACKIQGYEKYSLENGEKITLTITNAEELAKTYGKIPATVSHEYEVSGLDSYVSKVEQLPKDVIRSFAEKFMQEEQEDNDNEIDDMFSYSTVKYYSTYFMIPKEGALRASKNELHIIVYCDEYLRGDYFRTDYIPLVFKDIIHNADGTVILEYDSGSSTTFTTDINLHLDDLKEKYIIEEIKDLNIEPLPEKEAKTETPAKETTGTPTTTTPDPVVTTKPTTPAHTHSYTDTVISPTCTENGYTLHSCACGYSYKDNNTWKLGHLYLDWYTVKAATTTETGLKECKCDKCGGAPIYKETPKRPEGDSIDSRVEIENVYGKISYRYGSCSVGDFRTWGNVFKISVTAQDGLRVVYDNQNGELIEFVVTVPPEGYCRSGVVWDNGSYDISTIGRFS
ncbi:MAG: hypothetical protein IJ292_04590 [Clostridia bacterium]|nr:hypothetical protein [Clostridia bacterium]